MSWYRPGICFKPRARTGRDASCVRVPASAPGFKPRARTGRDMEPSTTSPASRCFKPRARTGRDSPRHTVVRTDRLFQATRPHGARQYPPKSEQRQRFQRCVARTPSFLTPAGDRKRAEEHLDGAMPPSRNGLRIHDRFRFAEAVIAFIRDIVLVRRYAVAVSLPNASSASSRSPWRSEGWQSPPVRTALHPLRRVLRGERSYLPVFGP